MDNAPAQQTPSLVDRVLAAAADPSTDVDKMQRLWDMAKDIQATEARTAYNMAIAKFKANPPTVVKDKLNKQFGSSYTSIENLVNTVNEALAEDGLNARWEYAQDEKIIIVACVLSHIRGHSERVTLSAPPDTSGSKNSIQQIKSTTTYLKIMTFEAVTGIASSVGNTNDDGNLTELITDEQTLELEALINDNSLDMEVMLRQFGLKELGELPAKKFDKAKARIATILEKRSA